MVSITGVTHERQEVSRWAVQTVLGSRVQVLLEVVFLLNLFCSNTILARMIYFRETSNVSTLCMQTCRMFADACGVCTIWITIKLSLTFSKLTPAYGQAVASGNVYKSFQKGCHKWCKANRISILLMWLVLTRWILMKSCRWHEV